MPGLELQVSLGQNIDDEPPLATAAPAGGVVASVPASNGVGVATPAPAPAIGPTDGGGNATVGAGSAVPASAPGGVGDGSAATVPGFEPTEEQMVSFIQVTGAVRSVARGEKRPCRVVSYLRLHVPIKLFCAEMSVA